MKDLKLDFENKDIKNEYVDNKARVIQQIRIAVKVWIGDWMLDEEFGIDYNSSWGNTLTMSTYVQAQIKQVTGVSSIESFSIKKQLDDNNQEQYYIDAFIKFGNEVIVISEGV